MRCFKPFLFIFATLPAFAGEMKVVECKNEALQPKLSPDATQVSYLMKEKGRKYSLFLKAVKSASVERKLVDNAYKRGTYSWSHDGKKIACTVKNRIKKNVVVIDLKSGKKSIVREGKNPKFNFDDSKLAFLTKKDVLVHDFLTGKTENITDNPQRGEMNSLCWGANGQTIYYSKDGDLWKASLVDRKNERIINHTEKSSVSAFIGKPEISGDKETIFYSLISDGLYAHASDNLIGKYELASGKSRALFEANAWTLSPDGKSIVYSLGPDIFIRDSNGGGQRKICSGLSPYFSLDGKAFVFFRRDPKTDFKNIYVMKMEKNWSCK